MLYLYVFIVCFPVAKATHLRCTDLDEPGSSLSVYFMLGLSWNNSVRATYMPSVHVLVAESAVSW